ncbi:carboxymuconolactone decarboxylase family protein [Pseudarthrobacter oxydans]|uniref:carboxymuconolactone decarboxylase family protein n=1 Tax=Pseudarthrobacter oxydans TaxID=1671 RepID=UPI002AA7E730|nr:carboxymuconolactone decarboxylase family protein [Pseudarthrobacter oxydans]WPU10439.1 carboxymuconolactone decarboxylase family protein [Pseudarthrobacter oxydans]HET7784061.1 carboxymuconolactone decarboxylase family protein [Arthrobacter sp.]HEU4667779.1 carboxymuconolactone decarboxylase family protein [Arthrobacter sp.]HSO16024.1 carboxymuconolactone decarboxylase family protein [Arthrobacter sp.]
MSKSVHEEVSPAAPRGGRFPLLAPPELSDQQRDLYVAIAGPPRGNGPFSIVDEGGCLTGPFNALLYSPAIGSAVQALGAVLRFGGSLPDRTRELVICAVAAELESAYEWYAHSRVATTVGVNATELQKLHDGESPDTLSADEGAALGLALALLRGTAVGEDVHAAALEHFGHSGITELSVLVGYYRLLAGILAAGDVPVPPAATGEPRTRPAHLHSANTIITTQGEQP